MLKKKSEHPGGWETWECPTCGLKLRVNHNVKKIFVVEESNKLHIHALNKFEFLMYDIVEGCDPVDDNNEDPGNKSKGVIMDFILDTEDTAATDADDYVRRLEPFKEFLRKFDLNEILGHFGGKNE